MKLARTTVIASFLISFISFLAYICPWPPILLSAEHANETLLALFGAGISSLFVGTLEYRSERTKLEQRIITQAEPVLSSIAGLQAITVENYTSIADHKDSADFLIQQLANENPIQLLSIKTQGNTQADGQLFSQSTTASSQQSPTSGDDHLNRYIQRHKGRISQAARDYANTANRLKDTVPPLHNTISEVAYLSTTLHIPWGSGAGKYKCLREIDSIVDRFHSDFENSFGACRLFINEQSSYSDTLRTLLHAQQLLEGSGELERPSNSKVTTNWYADSLYRELRKYAELIKYGDIPGPWW